MLKFRRCVVQAVAVLVVMMFSGLGHAAAAHVLGPRVAPSRVDRAPDPTADAIFGISATAADDAWAVGDYCPGTGCSPWLALVLHWDGSDWSQMVDLNTSHPTEGLRAVSALSANDVWAVGRYCTDECGRDDHTLIVHWDGSSWSEIESPSPGRSDALYGVAALSANDVWAVGQDTPASGASRTLILHWDGSDWSRVKSPAPAGTSFLNGVSVTSTIDAWAVGHTEHGPKWAFHAFILHWDGKAWSRVKVSALGKASALDSVSSVSARGAWAVGRDCKDGQCFDARSLILHWNGKVWSKATTPNRSGNNLQSVTARSARDVWAVGMTGGLQLGNATIGNMILHWNGRVWSRVKSPQPHPSSSLWGVDSSSAGDAWAVGYKTDMVGSLGPAFIVHWDGHHWSKP